MKPTPPRGFIVVDALCGPAFIRASAIVCVDLDMTSSKEGETTIYTSDGSWWVATNDISEVLAAINAASTVEQNGVAASFVANVVEQMLKQQAGAATGGR